MTASYNDIAGAPWAGRDGLLSRMLPFIGNSMAAGWNLIGERGWYRFGRNDERTLEYARGAMRPGDRLVYVVWSYATDIATYDPETGETTISPNYWGMTTAKHLGYCRRSLPAIRSNDPSAIDGIGPDCRVEWQEGGDPFGAPEYGRVIETHPLAGAIRVRSDEFNPATERVLPRESVRLAR